MCVCVHVCACVYVPHQLKGCCGHIVSAVLQLNHIDDVKVVETDGDSQTGQQPSRGGGRGRKEGQEGGARGRGHTAHNCNLHFTT